MYKPIKKLCGLLNDGEIKWYFIPSLLIERYGKKSESNLPVPVREEKQRDLIPVTLKALIDPEKQMIWVSCGSFYQISSINDLVDDLLQDGFFDNAVNVELPEPLRYHTIAENKESEEVVLEQPSKEKSFMFKGGLLTPVEEYKASILKNVIRSIAEKITLDTSQWNSEETIRSVRSYLENERVIIMMQYPVLQSTMPPFLQKMVKEVMIPLLEGGRSKAVVIDITSQSL